MRRAWLGLRHGHRDAHPAHSLGDDRDLDRDLDRDPDRDRDRDRDLDLDPDPDLDQLTARGR